uniref:Uncharacterized protein n=1 Tax=Aegilops tauschii subsp. strangulata TaxID=200361 RepID=A0A452YAR0_AEGTS
SGILTLLLVNSISGISTHHFCLAVSPDFILTLTADSRWNSLSPSERREVARRPPEGIRT